MKPRGNPQDSALLSLSFFWKAEGRCLALILMRIKTSSRQKIHLLLHKDLSTQLASFDTQSYLIYRIYGLQCFLCFLYPLPLIHNPPLQHLGNDLYIFFFHFHLENGTCQHHKWLQSLWAGRLDRDDGEGPEEITELTAW